MKSSSSPSPTLTIEQLSGLASFQDMGREHAQHLGFSASGVADLHAAAFANQVLNKPVNSPVIELKLAELTIISSIDLECCLTGAECTATIDNHPIVFWQKFTIKAGQSLKISRPIRGVYAYLTTSYNFTPPLFLASSSPVPAVMSNEIGIHPLKAGERIALSSVMSTSSEKPQWYYRPRPRNFYHFEHLYLRFIPSNLYLAQSNEIRQSFLSQTYSVSNDSNKMGYRFDGSPLLLDSGLFQLLSRPTPYGAIQINAQGLPIVLMKDRQTIGGYPVFGYVMQTDLYRLSQMRPKTKLTFSEVTLRFAQQQLTMFNQRLAI